MEAPEGNVVMGHLNATGDVSQGYLLVMNEVKEAVRDHMTMAGRYDLILEESPLAMTLVNPDMTAIVMNRRARNSLTG